MTKRSSRRKTGAHVRTPLILAACAMVAIGGGMFMLMRPADKPDAIGRLLAGHAGDQTPVHPPQRTADTAAAPSPDPAMPAVGPPRKPAKPARMTKAQKRDLDLRLVAQFRKCWNFAGRPAGDYVPALRIAVAPDGALSGTPRLLNIAHDPSAAALAKGAAEAVARCNPLQIPANYAAYYDEWRTRVVRFDPSVFSP